MKPITQFSNASLLRAMTCKGSCPEHEGYTPMAIWDELERRLKDRDDLQKIYSLACFVVDPEDREDVPYAIEALRQEITQHQMNKRNETNPAFLVKIRGKAEKRVAELEAELAPAKQKVAELEAQLEHVKALMSVVC